MNAFKQVKYMGWSIIAIPTFMLLAGLWFGLTRDTQVTHPVKIEKEAVKIEPKVEKPVAVEPKEEPKVEPKVEKPKPVQKPVGVEETQDTAELHLDTTSIIKNTVDAEIDFTQAG
jgi:outer membrane biosynthesis protein TonB